MSSVHNIAENFYNNDVVSWSVPSSCENRDTDTQTRTGRDEFFPHVTALRAS